MRHAISLFAALALSHALTPPRALEYGASSIGFAIERLPAHDGLLPGSIQLWYPTAAACSTPLTYADYLASDAPDPGHDVAGELRQGWSFSAPPLDDAAWTRVVATPMRACRDAAPRGGDRAPVIIAVQLGGAWPVAAEYFTSHGYAFAVVGRPLASAPAGTIVERMTARKQGDVRDLEAALTRLQARTDLDLSRVGALGQTHALLMLAARQSSVRAVALQDGDFQAGNDAESDRQTGMWQPGNLQAAVLHAIASDRVGEDTAWPAFRSATRGPSLRLVITPPHLGHNDVTADGYLIRTRAPMLTPPHDTLVRVYEGLLRAQRGFFDQHLRGGPAEWGVDSSLFTIEK